MHSIKKQIVVAAAAASLATFTLAAQADEPKVKKLPDESWITVNGTVASAGPNSFKLDYGEGLITVEMDDWGWYEEGHLLIEGDQVTVQGRVDDGLFEKRTIEAGSVYVEDLNSYFYANTADEEGDAVLTTVVVATPVDGDNWVTLTGVVKDVSGREFELDTGYGEVTVDTSAMRYNPLDDEGFQRLDRGQAVAVRGLLDVDLFERTELVADVIYSLNADAAKTAARTEGGYTKK